MPARSEVTRNNNGRRGSAWDRRANANEPYANVYDVFGFVLQLLQMAPIISACLAPLIANSWLVRSLVLLFLVVSGLGTRHLAAQHQRRTGRQAGEARHHARSPGRAFPKVLVVHRVRVSPQQHIAHCSCRAHACPRVGGTGVVADVRRAEEAVGPQGEEPGPVAPGILGIHPVDSHAKIA